MNEHVRGSRGIHSPYTLIFLLLLISTLSNGAYAQIHTANATLDFGDVALDESKSLTVTYTANDFAGIEIFQSFIGLSALGSEGLEDFSYTFNDCPVGGILEFGQSCRRTITFKPTQAGRRSGQEHFHAFCVISHGCTSQETRDDDYYLIGNGIDAPGDFCPTVFDPVCSVDNVTYNNACEAERAGVEIAYEGACVDRPTISITSPTKNQRINLGRRLSFTSAASSENPDFTPSYSWNFPGGTPGGSTAKDPSSIIFDTLGIHTVTVTVRDDDNGQSATDSLVITVEEPPDEGFIAIQPDLPEDLRRPTVDLGLLLPEATPVIGGMVIENSSTEPFVIEQIGLTGQGFKLSSLNILKGLKYYTKAGEPLDYCAGRKSSLNTLDPTQRCGIDFTFDPSGLPSGLHTGLLKISTSLGERIAELLVKVDGQPALYSEGRLLNLSTNGQVDANSMIAGFIVSGTEPRRIVLLGENENGLQDPELQLSDFTGSTIHALNNNWRDHPSATEIQTELREPRGILDAALAITLEPGVYLAWLSDRNGHVGQGTLAINDISAPPAGDTTRLLNISTNSQVTSTTPMIAGFIVSGLQSVDFVIMGERMNNSDLNPKLRVTNFVANPADLIEYASNDDWQNHPTAADVVARDRFPGSTMDAAFVITLEPGVYLAWLESEDSQAGQGLISITEVSP